MALPDENNGANRYGGHREEPTEDNGDQAVSDHIGVTPHMYILPCKRAVGKQ